MNLVKLYQIYLFFLNILFSNSRTLLIGLDGFNPSDILVHPDDYPNINLMIRNGSSTLTARTAVETISAPGWTSILCSLDSSDTGILDNNWVPGEIKDITEVDDQINSDKLKLPCIFETIKNYDPNIYTGFYYEWDWLSYFGNDYSEKINVDDERFCNGVNLMSTLLCSVKHVQMLIDKIKNEDFDFLFIYINIVDDSGHAFNWLSSGYNHYVRKFDEFLGRIFNAFSEKNILNSTYIMLTSDHGGRPGSRFHGEQKNSSLFIPWIIIGPDVKKNYSIKTNVHAMDSAPTILHTLNIPSNPLWRGKVIYEIFENEV